MRGFAQHMDIGEGGYRRSWYTDAIGDALDLALLSALGLPGGVDCVAIFMPPRHGKTLHAAELLPPYAYSRKHDLEVIYYTYSVTRARGAAKSVRSILGSPRYRAIANARIGSATAEVWDESLGALSTVREEGEASANTLDILREGAPPGARRGRYLATSLGSAATGYGAHLSIYDDLVKNSADATSAARQALIRTELQTVAETRLSPQNAQVLITTRWAPGDPADFLLQRWADQGKSVLNLTLRAIREDEDNPLDPRAPGEILDAARAHIYAAARSGEAWDALFQQRPSLGGGTMLPRSGWGRFDPAALADPAHGGIFEEIVLSVDPNFKAGGTSYAQIDVWAIVALPGLRPWDSTRREAWKLGEVRGKWDWSDFRRAFYQTWERWGASVRTILVEESANGHALLSDVRATLLDRQRPPWARAVPVGVPTRGVSKEMRAILARPGLIAGLYRVPASAHGLVSVDWVEAHLEEIDRFGRERGNDDRVDTFVQLARWASSERGVRPPYSIVEAEAVYDATSGGERWR